MHVYLLYEPGDLSPIGFFTSLEKLKEAFPNMDSFVPIEPCESVVNGTPGMPEEHFDAITFPEGETHGELKFSIPVEDWREPGDMTLDGRYWLVVAPIEANVVDREPRR